MVLYTTNNIHCNYLTDEAVTILKDKPVEHWANVDITKGQSMESSDKLFWKVIGTHLHKMASHENVEGFVYILCQMRKTFKHFTIASSLTHFFCVIGLFEMLSDSSFYWLRTCFLLYL